MYVFELLMPGTRLDYEDQEWCWKIESLLRHLESQFFEANAALNLFEHSQLQSSNSDTDQWEADRNRRSEIRQEVESEVCGNAWENFDAIELETEIRFKRQKWASGRLPRELEWPKPFIHARAFLYALDMFDKFLRVLSKEAGVSAEMAKISEQVGEVFPDLRLVRNSSQHLEDRARGLGGGRNPKPLELKPVQNGMIDAPSGALILNSLNGNKYGCTMSDGHYVQVEVSAQSMEELRKLLVAVFSCFKWKGGKRHLPS